MNAGIVEGAQSTVRQGIAGTSNVNVIQEMTNRIQATKTLESTQKIIKAFYMMNEKLAT